MSNIYLKVTIEKNWRSQNFDFLSLRNLSPVQFLLHIFEFLNFLLQLRNLRSGNKTVCGFSIILILKKFQSLQFAHWQKLLLDKNRFTFKLECFFKVLGFLDGLTRLNGGLDYGLEILKI